MTANVLPAIPQRIGPYQIVARIAEGGMGTVYRGRTQDSEEPIAIKILSPEVASNTVAVERFRQEYRASNSLVHPHLVRGLDFGQEEGLFYLVMEFVDGDDLATRIEKKKRLDEDEAVRILVQVAEALQLAHDHQIIHRDVKPSNILLTATGEAKLTDLGLVKCRQSDLDLTRPMAGLGTPHFMAPEQFGDAKHADVRCDVYSLGATLYNAVTGQLPFDARSHLNMLKKKLKNDIPPPRQLVPKLSESVDLAIRRAMRADPTQRQASCLEFIASLTGVSLPPDSILCGGVTPPAQRADIPRSDLEFPSKSKKAAERRVAVRYPSDREASCLPVARTKEKSWSAKVQDISATGICMRVSRRFEPGTILMVELTQPDQRIPRSVLARVQWVRRQSPRVWLLGCAFQSPLLDFEVDAWI
jgi:serine/threonine protein kinase